MKNEDLKLGKRGGGGHFLGKNWRGGHPTKKKSFE